MEFAQTRAIYQQVADHVCEMILRGTWPEGERIPPVRELAMELEVNPNTVNKAYAYLQDRAIIHNRRGIGYSALPDARTRAGDLKRHEFVSEELPRMFRTMELIDMTIPELVDCWREYQASQEGEDQ